MGFWSKVKDWIFGIDLITADELKAICNLVIDNADRDKDGYISVSECVEIIKGVAKYGTRKD